jgi:RTA1 like protein
VLINYAEIDPYRITYFVVQYFFIVVAPVLFSASIYAILSVLITRTGTQYSPLPPKAILWTFITSDVICTVIQIIGSALVGVQESKRRDPTFANDILLAGLAVQVFSFLVFVILLSAFLWRARGLLFKRNRTVTSNDKPTVPSSESEMGLPALSNAKSRPISRSFLVALSVATLAVYLRTCYRLSDTAQYNYGSRAHNVKEGFYGGLEFAPIVICVYLLSIWHPGRCFNR